MTLDSGELRKDLSDIALAAHTMFALPVQPPMLYIKIRILNSLYDSEWPHSKFGAHPFENSKNVFLNSVKLALLSSSLWVYQL